MQLTSSPTYFKEDDSEGFSFNNLMNAMKKGIDSKNTIDKFYTSANDIIKLFNKHNLDSNAKYGKKLISEQITDANLENASIKDLSNTIDNMVSTHNRLYSFTKDKVEDEAMKPYMEIQSKLLEQANKYKARREVLESAIVNKVDDTKKVDDVEAVPEYERLEDYNLALDTSFSRGKSYESADFTPRENNSIRRSAVAGNVLTQISAVKKRSPTYSNTLAKNSLYRRLKTLYGEDLPPRVKAKIYFELYKNEIEGNNNG